MSISLVYEARRQVICNEAFTKAFMSGEELTGCGVLPTILWAR